MRCLLLSLLVLLGFQAKAQCSVDVVNDSLYACEGDSVTLQALGTGPFAWTRPLCFRATPAPSRALKWVRWQVLRR